MERKCIRCDENMILNCNLKVYEGGGALFAHRPIYSVYKEAAGWGKDEDIKIAVCPKCGYGLRAIEEDTQCKPLSSVCREMNTHAYVTCTESKQASKKC